jgi:hypothetical protein
MIGQGQARKAGTMRGGRYLVVLAGVGVLAAGCGTKVAPAGNVAAAAASTAGRAARVAITTTMRMQGMSVSFTETGAFDFAHSRGVLRMQGPAGMATEEIFIPPRMYVKLPGAAHGLLPPGKSWIAIEAAPSGGLGTSLFGPFGGTDPRDLLSSLTAISSSVAKLGSAAIRGVQVTHFRVSVDPAKAASRVPRWQRAGFHAFAKSLGAVTVPVDVWVDQQNLVRRVRISLHPPGGSGEPAGARITQTADFYDFGVPVRVSAPPAAEVASMSQLAKGRAPIGTGGTGTPRPPRVSGTLSPAQATAAGQVVRAFWSALGSNDMKAVAQTVLPAQRTCFRSMMSGPRFTVSSLRIVSAQPAGNARATVRFTVKARASIGGHSVPVLPQGPDRVQWLVTTETGGHWLVDLGRSSLAFGPACQ